MKSPVPPYSFRFILVGTAGLVFLFKFITVNLGISSALHTFDSGVKWQTQVAELLIWLGCYRASWLTTAAFFRFCHFLKKFFLSRSKGNPTSTDPAAVSLTPHSSS